VDPPRVPRHEVLAISPSGAQAILESVRSDRLETLYYLALATGLRQGECLALRWDDVDLIEGSVTVRGALQRVDGELRVVEPKTARSRRAVAIQGGIVVSLRGHRRRQLEERVLAGPEWVETGFVFTNRVGKALDGTHVTIGFQAMLAKAGLPRMRFHDLRHAAASLLLAQGVHPRVVMEMLGHSTIALTMNLYSHVIPALQHDAATKMDEALGR
jgi:integrase